MKQQRGYSLVEILVVVAIIGMFSLAAVPSFLTMMRSSQIKSANRQVTSDLRVLRQACVTRSARGRMTFTTGDNDAARVYNLQLFQAGAWVPLGATRRLEFPIYFSETTFINTTGDADVRPDIVVEPNGSATAGSVSVRTTNKLPKNQYNIIVNVAGTVTSTAVAN